MIGYPRERLYQEVAYIAYYFHESTASILAMPHWERLKWCEEIGRINRELSRE